MNCALNNWKYKFIIPENMQMSSSTECPNSWMKDSAK